jgi:bacteriocin-like protein
MSNDLTELTDTELDAVTGGIFNFGNIITQINNAENVGVALNLGGLGGVANVAQFIGQGNFSL